MWRSALNCHEKQINGPEGTVFKKPKIFFSFTQRDEQADRNITSLYALFFDQDEPLTRLTTQVENLQVVPHLLQARKRHPQAPKQWVRGVLRICFRC